MKLLLRIVTNKQFIGKREVANKGAFYITPETYINKKRNVEMLKNDDVFFALAYGESDIYVDSGDYYLTNIMHYKHRNETNTQLLGIFIIQYLIQQDIVFDKYGYDTDISIEGNQLVDTITDLFSFPTEQKKKDMHAGLEQMMKHLYEGGALLQSLIEPTYEDAHHYKRVYHKDMKVFLSRRGKELYSMLNKNSLLLEVYRDDIETDLVNNDITTLKLSKTSRILYCLDYIEQLHFVELQLLRLVTNKREFEDTIGVFLPTVILLNGIRESVTKYYTQPSQQRDEIVTKYNALTKEIREAINIFNEEGNYSFINAEFI